MTTLIIQVPCHNETAQQLPATLGALKRALPAVSCIESLVVDDGSSDDTAEVARNFAVDNFVRLPRNKGHGFAFSVKIEAALRAGADIIVNADTDNCYHAADIAALVAPILADEAEIVIGAWPLAAMEHFSLGKRWMQAPGCRVGRLISGLDVPDAISGLRAFARDAALTVNVFSG